MLLSTVFTILCTLSALLGLAAFIYLARTPRPHTCPSRARSALRLTAPVAFSMCASFSTNP